jgi:hypothetical protein
MDFLLREQAVLRTAAAVQNDINRLLGREQPTRALSATDLNVHNLMQGFDPDRLPYLIDELERLLGIHIALDMDHLTITRRDAAASSWTFGIPPALGWWNSVQSARALSGE